MLLGKPTVISKLPNLQDIVFPEKSIYTLVNDDEVTDLIIQAFNEDSETLKHSRIEFAMQNTWDIRVGEFMNILRTHFPDLLFH